jgi:hypothetical protein
MGHLVGVAAAALGGEEQLRIGLAARRPLPPVPALRTRCGGGRRWLGEPGPRGGGALVKRDDALAGPQRGSHVADVVGGHAQPVGELAGARRPVGIMGLFGPQLLQPAARAGRSGSQAGQLLGDLPARHAELAGQARLIDAFAAADFAGPVAPLHLRRGPLGVGRSARDGGLLVVTGGEVRLELGHLLRAGLAVTDLLAQHPGQAVLAGLLGAKRVEPLAGDLRGGPHLLGNLGRLQRLTPTHLAGEVGVGDLVADQPPPQLRKAGVALALGTQRLEQIRGESRVDATSAASAAG